MGSGSKGSDLHAQITHAAPPFQNALTQPAAQNLPHLEQPVALSGPVVRGLLGVGLADGQV